MVLREINKKVWPTFLTQSFIYTLDNFNHALLDINDIQEFKLPVWPKSNCQKGYSSIKHQEIFPWTRYIWWYIWESSYLFSSHETSRETTDSIINDLVYTIHGFQVENLLINSLRIPQVETILDDVIYCFYTTYWCFSVKRNNFQLFFTSRRSFA